MRRTALVGALLLALLSVVAAPGSAGRAAPAASAAAPALPVTEVMTGLDHPWDVGFAPDGSMFVTERAGRVSIRLPNGTTRQLTADFSDLWVSGETGLMAVEVDPQFASNRRIYTCQGTTDNGFTVQIVAWQVNAGLTALARTNDPLIGGIDGTTGRHGGCQLRIDGAGDLWVGTGDAAWGTNAQDLSSLAGKTLRVNRFTGQPVAGNLSGPIFTYGHRNIQGLAVRPGSGDMWSVEHGSSRDDEVNRLVSGGNYGWNPVPLPYNEAVPMTAPGAIGALWSSGPSTIAPSAATFLQGQAWGWWQGALAMSVLKDRELRIMFFDASGRFTGHVTPPELDGTYGRLRAAEMGPGGRLFLTTDNGGSDRVLSVGPPPSVPAPGCATAVTSSQPGTIDMATRGADDQAWVRSWTGASWTGWSPLGGILTSGTAVSSRGSGSIDLFSRGRDSAIWHNSRHGGAWSGWVSLGGIATSAPATVSWGPDRIDVFARGRDGALWGNAWTPGGWQGWYSLGGQLSSEPSVSSWAENRLDVFARGMDGAIWHRAFAGTGWMGWESLGGIATSGPTSVSWGSDRIDLFARGGDGALWGMYWNIDRLSGWYPLGGGLGSAPSVTARSPDSLDVYACGLDGTLFQQSWTGSRWTGWFQPG